MAHAVPSGPSADRNLLFGVLALQADLLDAARFAEACTAWSARKDTPLASLLVERGWLTPDERRGVEQFLERKLKKHAGDVRASLAEVLSDPVRQTLTNVADPVVRQTLSAVATPDGVHEKATVNYQPAGRERYTLNRLHAQGGIGRVWVARDGDLGREVALKELLGGGDNPAVVARFVEEAQITGQLQHPNIVPVYELARPAEPPKGPFYTMRFVRGRTLAAAIKQYHEKRRSNEAGPLELRELLNQFVAVCNAVAFAHSRGVLHRDLKPGNVVLGDFGEVIVLDWGLAKLKGAAEPQTSLLPVSVNKESSRDATVQGQAIGTPSYMPPEQAEGRVDLIDERSDVYGLGAVLYDILTGEPPFDGPDTPTVLIQVVADEPPPPRRKVPETPKPLEAVCLKALAKKPAERYATVKELARDVERWLGDEPVSVFREPVLVKTGRWVKQHSQGVTAAATLVLAAVPLLILLAVNREHALRQSEIQREENRQQREIAEANERIAREREAETHAVVDFLQNKVVAAARPEGQEGGLGVDVSLRKAIDTALPAVAESFAGQPLIEAKLRMTLGDSFLYLREDATAEEQFRAARAIYTRERGPNDPDTLRTAVGLARSYDQLARYDDAVSLLEKTLPEQKARLGPDHPDTLATMDGLGGCYIHVGRLADALRVAEETLNLRKARQGPDHRDTLRSMDALARVYLRSGRNAEAIKLEEAVLALLKTKRGPGHHETIAAMGHLARCYVSSGRETEALKLDQEAVRLCSAKLGPDHSDTLVQTKNVAADLECLGRHAEAARLLEQTLAKWQATKGPDHPDALDCMGTLCNVYNQMGRYDEGVKLSERALALLRAKFGADNPETMAGMYDLADSYEKQDRHEDALKLFREAWTLRRAKFGPDNPETIRVQMRAGRSYQSLGRYAEALPLQEEALKLGERRFGPDDARTMQLKTDLADTYGSLGRYPEAVRLLREATPKMEKSAGADPLRMYNVACFHGMIAKYLLASGKGAEIARQADGEAEQTVHWLRKAVEAGYSQPHYFKTDKDLDAVRAREDFKKVLAELEAKAAEKK